MTEETTPAHKAFTALKAEELTRKQLDRWLSGEMARRVLVTPFGGPLPGGKSGLDLDGEYFDEKSDLYGPAALFPALHASRQRIVDWHHDDFGVPEPASKMKGVILGHIELDGEPEDDGLWADWWAKAGERRMALVKALETRNVPLYGSSEAVVWGVKKADDGHIEQWPIVRHTITTSPQNTFAVVPALKALLTESASDGLTLAALQAAIAGLLDAPDLGQLAGLSAQPAIRVVTKAGRVLSAENEAALRDALTALGKVLAKLDAGTKPPQETRQ